jgi:hypothetical protein
LLLGKSEAMSSIRLSKPRHDIEAILFRAFAGLGNDKIPLFGKNSSSGIRLNGSTWTGFWTA